MALAEFFNKAALSASQILQGYDRSVFEEKLNSVTIEIAFDDNAVLSFEGRATLDLTLRLAARLYPKIFLLPMHNEAQAKKRELEALAKSINPMIEFVSDEPFATLIVGKTRLERKNATFYVGSDHWKVLFSTSKPVGSAFSQNPFGAGAAACFGAANIFRLLFNDQLHNASTDSDFSLSLVTFEKNNDNDLINEIEFSEVKLEETFLVGFGAIGNGSIWALSLLENVQGIVNVIDDQKIELSNLQRYVLATTEDIDQEKISLCKKFNLNGIMKPCKGKFAAFLSERNNWHLSTVLLAVDSVQDRIAIQAALPKYIINAWTQSADLGISRHFDFNIDACVGCLYPAKGGLPSKSQLIADSLGLPDKELDLREIIYNNAPLGEFWLRQIATAKGIEFDSIAKYVDMPISTFYTQVLCGGLVTFISSDREAETPMAFQSALAGILLASELVIFQMQKKTSRVPTTTRINLLQPLHNYLNEPFLKRTGATSCICIDPDFTNRYKQKYSG